MIPVCFSSPSTVSGSSQVPQNLITSIYQTHFCKPQTYVTLTWSRSLFSHTLTIHAADCFAITISLYPSAFSFFRNRSGSKTIYLINHNYKKVKLYWDFTRAIFDENSAEPESCFYIAITCNGNIEFFLGDLRDELIQRSVLALNPLDHQLPEAASLISRREHVFGCRSYATKAFFLGSRHEIVIECNGGVLKVKVDGETSLVVKRLAWKFRGNERILVNGVEVDFFWDVFNWVNDVSNASGHGHGVFVFQVGECGVVWPEMVGPEKRLMRKSLSSLGSGSMPPVPVSSSPSSSSVLQWAEESSDGSRSSCSSSTRSCGSNGGFSLMLYAWRRD